MKTAKLAMIAALVAFGMTSFSANDPEVYPREVKISLQHAKCERSLVYAMYHQIDQHDLLAKELPGLYVARVRCANTIYLVHATYKEWKTFFTILRMYNCRNHPEN